ncbi:MAG TPA: M14 family metallopeptidase [Gemmatimonadota bacterium]|nr:M14 family metallopeptidase [Gemmatimonadota bacterium]
MTLRALILCVVLMGSQLPSQGSEIVRAQEAAVLRTRAEQTGFVETSRYKDVIEFLAAVDSVSPDIQVTAFGYSFEGRALPLAIWMPDSPTAGMTPPAGKTPTDGRIRVLVFANIHAGEVEGKEAAQMLLRDLATGRHAAWGDSLSLLLAPIYNADGNERVTLTNRPLQLGPIGGMGQRPNAQGLDLNRDFTKLDTPEARSLVGLLRDYDPHVVIDLHTTNGTFHGYHLTYSPPLHPATDASIDRFMRDSLFPAVTAALRAGPDEGSSEAPPCGRAAPQGEARTVDGDGCERLAELRRTRTWESHYYGNLPDDEGMEGAERAWYTFDHRPRFSNNYVGLRNRLGILSEAYAYLEFDERIAVTVRFVEEILDYVHAHASAIRRLTEAADARPLTGVELAVRAEIARSAEAVEILLGEVEATRHPYTGEVMLRRRDVPRPEVMPEYGSFAATETAVVPQAYLVPAGLAKATDLLAAHGILHHALAEPATLLVQEFRITGSSRAEEEFQGHRERTLDGAWGMVAERTIPAGTIVVPLDQPLARLAVLLLEPRSDDGLVNWGQLDAVLEGAGTYPILRTDAVPPGP